MNNTTTILIITATLLLTGCTVLQGSGVIINQQLPLQDFDTITMAWQGDVHLRQGEHYNVSLAIEDNIYEQLSITVKDNELTIKKKDPTTILRPTQPVHYYITLPTLKAATVAGSGDINLETPFTAETLTLIVAGSGDINLETIEAQELDITVAGSGDVNAAQVRLDKLTTTIAGSGHTTISGWTNNLEHHVAGSGDLAAAGLQAKNASIRIDGSGDAEVNVIDYLDVNIAGSGTVYYQGSAQITSTIAGSGDVRRLN